MFELTTLTVIQHFLLGYVRELRQRFAINGIVLLYLILLGLTSQPLWISSTSIPCFSSILPPSLSHGFRFCSTVQAKQIFVFFPSHMHLKKKIPVGLPTLSLIAHPLLVSLCLFSLSPLPLQQLLLIQPYILSI